MASTSSIDIALNKSLKQIPISKNSESHATCINKGICKEFICVEHPVVSDNEEKLLKTLGGTLGVELAVGNGSPLTCRLRPDDIYSKPIVADKDDDIKILIKVTARIPNTSMPSTSSVKPKELNTTFKYEFLGLTNTNFKFNRMADFQYLPLTSTGPIETANTPCKNIYNDILPKNLPDLAYIIEKASMVEYFPPPNFIKSSASKDNKLCYDRYEYYKHVLPQYAEKLKKKALGEDGTNIDNRIKRMRPKRRCFSRLVNFKARNVVAPCAPLPGALKDCQFKGFDKHLNSIKKLFEEQPLWTKYAISHKTNLGSVQLKTLLPCVAYYCTNGPWRTSWCKFGYNPSEDFNALLYQSLDLRVSSDKLKHLIQPKRTSNAVSLKTSKSNIKNETTTVNESYYILKMGVLPPARQTFYQYCNIYVREIQDKLNEILQDSSSLKYTLKDGWLPTGFENDCRKICIQLIRSTIVNEESQMDCEETPDKPEETLELEQLQLIDDDVMVIDESESSEADAKLNSEESCSDEDDISNEIMEKIQQSEDDKN